MGKRLTGIGILTEIARPEPQRPYRVIDITKGFAAEWDQDMLNRVYLREFVSEMVEVRAKLPNGYGVDLRYRGRIFATVYPPYIPFS